MSYGAALVGSGFSAICTAAHLLSPYLRKALLLSSAISRISGAAPPIAPNCPFIV